MMLTSEQCASKEEIRVSTGSTFAQVMRRTCGVALFVCGCAAASSSRSRFLSLAAQCFLWLRGVSTLTRLECVAHNMAQTCNKCKTCKNSKMSKMVIVEKHIIFEGFTPNRRQIRNPRKISDQRGKGRKSSTGSTNPPPRLEGAKA